MEATIYNIKGASVGEVKLPEAVFDVKWNSDVVHQVVTALQENVRGTVASTKGRGEVRGGGRKPWRQKGTGRARHGSTRSPIWVGGGVAHGPRKEKNYGQKVNRKVKTKALAMVLTKKMKDGEALFIDTLSFTAPKAKEAKGVLAGLASVKGFAGIVTRRKNAALIALPKREPSVEKSFRNFSNVAVEEIRNVTPLDLLTYRHVLIVDPQASLETLTARCS